jgi:hypothetical protein
MKHLKHLKYTLVACAFSATSSCCLSESRLVDAELDATEVTSAKLIGSAVATRGLLAVVRTELRTTHGCRQRGARWQHGALRRQHMRSLPVARREWVGYVRDTCGVGGCVSSRREEMHKLHNILPLPVALNGEAEERETRWNRRG